MTNQLDNNSTFWFVAHFCAAVFFTVNIVNYFVNMGFSGVLMSHGIKNANSDIYPPSKNDQLKSISLSCLASAFLMVYDFKKTRCGWTCCLWLLLSVSLLCLAVCNLWLNMQIKQAILKPGCGALSSVLPKSIALIVEINSMYASKYCVWIKFVFNHFSRYRITRGY